MLRAGPLIRLSQIKEILANPIDRYLGPLNPHNRDNRHGSFIEIPFPDPIQFLEARNKLNRFCCL